MHTDRCVCWRIAAGAVGWAWLLLGLATDRVGATNAFTAAIHVTAVRTRLWSIVNCSVAAFWLCQRRPAWRRAGIHDVPVFPTVPCLSGGVVLACRNALLELGASWTRAAASRGERGPTPGNLARAVPLWTGPGRDDGWTTGMMLR